MMGCLLIFVATNCIGSQILTRYRHLGPIQVNRLRSDAILSVVRGEWGSVAKSVVELTEAGAAHPPVPKGVDFSKVNAFLWTSYHDVILPFYLVGGTPVSPVWSGRSKYRTAFEAKYEFCERLTLEEKRKNWLAVDALLTEANPRMKKALVFYDYSRLFQNRKHHATGLAVADSYMMHTLGPLGWSLFPAGLGVPIRKDAIKNDWCHYSLPWRAMFADTVMGTLGFRRPNE